VDTCTHAQFETRVVVRPVPVATPPSPVPATSGRYQVLVQVRCADCLLPLVFELPVVPTMSGYVPAVSQSSNGQEAALAAQLIAPVVQAEHAVAWQEAVTLPLPDPAPAPAPGT
jgi:hypothetical protein